MDKLAIITPSYAPDFDLCRDLNASVLTYTPNATVHYIITPRRDLAKFSVLRGSRTEVCSVDQLLPGYMVGIPGANFWLNLRRVAPPVRGWIMQQVVKLQAAALIEADVYLLADSDVVFVRPVTAETFRRNGRIVFYRKYGSIDAKLPRHLLWHSVARGLLGLPSAPPPPLPDYISALNVWDRSAVLELQERIRKITGRPWLDSVAAQLHFSEFILYGVFVDEVLGREANVVGTDSMLCHSYWDPYPLDLDKGNQFINSMAVDDIAVMISAKSHTSKDVRQAILSRLQVVS
jgi:hypothetical protein